MLWFIKWINLSGENQHVYWFYIYTKWLTWREAVSKEHVKEIFRCNIRLKASVEIKSSMSAARLFSATYIILPLLVWVTEHCVSISNLWRRNRTALIVLYFMYINFLTMYWNKIGYGVSVSALLLKASVAPGAWFLSGWNFKANFL